MCNGEQISNLILTCKTYIHVIMNKYRFFGSYSTLSFCFPKLAVLKKEIRKKEEEKGDQD